MSRESGNEGIKARRESAAKFAGIKGSHKLRELTALFLS